MGWFVTERERSRVSTRDAHLSNDKAVAKMGHPEGRGEGAMTLKEFEAFRSYSLTFRSHSLSG